VVDSESNQEIQRNQTNSRAESASVTGIDEAVR